MDDVVASMVGFWKKRDDEEMSCLRLLLLLWWKWCWLEVLMMKEIGCGENFVWFYVCMKMKICYVVVCTEVGLVLWRRWKFAYVVVCMEVVLRRKEVFLWERREILEKVHGCMRSEEWGSNKRQKKMEREREREREERKKKKSSHWSKKIYIKFK